MPRKAHRMLPRRNLDLPHRVKQADLFRAKDLTKFGGQSLSYVSSQKSNFSFAPTRNRESGQRSGQQKSLSSFALQLRSHITKYSEENDTVFFPVEVLNGSLHYQQAFHPEVISAITINLENSEIEIQSFEHALNVIMDSANLLIYKQTPSMRDYYEVAAWAAMLGEDVPTFPLPVVLPHVFVENASSRGLSDNGWHVGFYEERPAGAWRLVSSLNETEGIGKPVLRKILRNVRRIMYTVRSKGILPKGRLNLVFNPRTGEVKVSDFLSFSLADPRGPSRAAEFSEKLLDPKVPYLPGILPKIVEHIDPSATLADLEVGVIDKSIRSSLGFKDKVNSKFNEVVAWQYANEMAAALQILGLEKDTRMEGKGELSRWGLDATESVLKHLHNEALIQLDGEALKKFDWEDLIYDLAKIITSYINSNKARNSDQTIFRKRLKTFLVNYLIGAKKGVSSVAREASLFVQTELLDRHIALAAGAPPPEVLMPAMLKLVHNEGLTWPNENSNWVKTVVELVTDELPYLPIGKSHWWNYGMELLKRVERQIKKRSLGGGWSGGFGGENDFDGGAMDGGIDGSGGFGDPILNKPPNIGTAPIMQGAALFHGVTAKLI